MGGFFSGAAKKLKKLVKSFKESFAEQWVCAENIVSHLQTGARFISVTAPVKSGKKIIKQILASEEFGFKKNGAVEFYMVTSLARKASESQLVELSLSGFDGIVRPSMPFSKKSEVPKSKRFTVDELMVRILKHPQIRFVLCWDESDYGLDVEGKAADLLKFLTGISAKNVQTVLFSATNQEIDNSSFAERSDFTKVRFVPSKDYRGAAWYLENDLVRPLGPGEDFTLPGETAEISETGKEFLDEFQHSGKALAIVRLPQRNKYGAMRKRCSEDEEFVKENFDSRGIAVLMIDQESSELHRGVLSSLSAFDAFLKEMGIDKLVVFLNQTYGRSAELKDLHSKIYGWFEQRGSNKSGWLKSNFAAMIQSILRMAFYHNEEKQGPVLDKVSPVLWVPPEVLEMEAYGKPVDGFRTATRVGAGTTADVVSYEDCYSGPFTMPMEEAKEYGKGNRTHVDTNKENLAQAIRNKSNPGTGAKRYKGPQLIFAGPCPWEKNPKHASLHQEEKSKLMEECPDIDWEDNTVAIYWIFDYSKRKSGKKSVEGSTTSRSAYSNV